MNIVRQSVKRLLTACLPEERWLVRGRCAHGDHGPALSLTFDDGPHPEYTPRVLDRLQQSGWKGTFFVVGERARQYPELVQRIVAEGHELGNHTFTHGEPSQTSAETLLEEIRETRNLLRQITGRRVSLFRPPKGELSLDKLRVTWREQQTVVLWCVDPKDYRPDAEADVRGWAARYKSRHGDIVLLHDSSPHSLAALDELQSHSRLTGFETVAVSTWLGVATTKEFSAEGLSCR